jgi:histidine ammonia-lyase
MKKLVLDGFNLNLKEAYEFSALAQKVDAKFKIEISSEARNRVSKCEDFVSNVVKGTKAVYGINTGFGKFAEVSIPRNDLELLQKNLILSHACGVGPELDRQIVLLMWIIRINILCRGHSGIRLSTIEFIISLLEKGILPCVPSRGSVGASGDLSPSAHASLMLIGEGSVTVPHSSGSSFERMTAAEALSKFGFKPISLAAKEGLALINGTQLTSALALIGCAQAKHLLETANFSLALSIEGLRASYAFLDSRVLSNRNQSAASVCGQQIQNHLGSKTEISSSHANCGRVQDPYSLRCAPQVHGAVLADILYSESVIQNEINSSTDNPLLFAEDLACVSGGNFHAIYTSRVCDMLSSALTTLSSICERRIALAMSPESSRLPAFLTENGGLNSGLMMAHVTAASLVSESKSLSFPASVDSIPTSDDREDHVSMGPGAGFKFLQIIRNTRQVLAIEILTASQAIRLLRPLKSSNTIEEFLKTLDPVVPKIGADRILSTDIQAIECLIEKTNWIPK